MRNDNLIDDSLSESNGHPSLTSSLRVEKELGNQMGSEGSSIQGTDPATPTLRRHQ